MEEYLCVKDIEDAALAILPKATGDYYKSGATDELTLAENRSWFKKLRIRPKCLVGVSQSSLRTAALGRDVALPIGIAPTALQKMASADGELASAKAAEEEGAIFILSTISTCSIEEVAKAAPNANKWFQLLIYKDKEVTRKLVERAEKAGFKAIVLTIDTPIIGIRRADLRNKFEVPEHLTLANFDGHLADNMNSSGEGNIYQYVSGLLDKSVTWEDIKWLKSITSLPIVAKGVLRGDDAARAARAGCAAVLVSNHGARQLDSVPATIEVLSEIVGAVMDYDVEVYLDGGVTTGTDIYKALALGAKMVFVGRPALWGLAVGGRAGVRRVLQILGTELHYALQIAGTPTIPDITRDMVRHESMYSKL